MTKRNIRLLVTGLVALLTASAVLLDTPPPCFNCWDFWWAIELWAFFTIALWFFIDAAVVLGSVSRKKHTGPKHQILTSDTCPCDKQSDTPCYVCDHGLAVCGLCGRAESALYEPCGPRP